jgi:hypothetical protein
MENYKKIFKFDRIVRDSEGKPFGRVILAEQYQEDEDIKVTLMTIPKEFTKYVKGLVVFIDEIPYIIPEDLHELKIGGDPLRWLINSFILKREK